MEMDPDLMGSPGTGESPEDAELIACHAANEAAFHAKLGQRRRSSWLDRLFQPDWRRLVRALPAQRRIDRSRFPFRPSPDNGEIFFCDALLLHEQPETSGRLSIFRYEHEPARFAIEPVYNRNLTAVRDLESEQML